MTQFEKMLNTITLGDSYELIKSIPDNSIDLVYTDIPYDITYSGGGCLRSNLKNAIEEINKDKNNLINGINYKILDEFCRVLKKVYLYIWCSKSQIYEIMKYFIDKDCNYNILCWCKTNPVPFGASNFLSDIEYCLCFYEKGCRFNAGIELKKKWYTSPINTRDKEKYKHPTIKPIELIKRHIKLSTQPNDIILDCFAGSGTTCVAAKELERQFIGIEINEEYHKISLDRLNGITAYGQISFDTDISKI